MREELLGAMGQLEDERHRARTLQRMVTSSSMREERQTVIRETRDNDRGGDSGRQSSRSDDQRPESSDTDS